MTNSVNSTEQQTEMNTPSASTSCAPASQYCQTGVTPISDVEGELCRLTELSLTLSTGNTISGQQANETKRKTKKTPSKPKPNEDPNTKNDAANVAIAENNKAASSSTPSTSKKKNARKKTKLKQLQMPRPDVAPQHPRSAPAAPASAPRPSPPDFMLPNNVTLEELFSKQIGPMYANHSHYLENLSHHPQYRLMQSHMYQQHAHNTNRPNSTHVQLPSFNSGHHPGMAHRQIDSTSPRYLQNVMQHPLLNKSYSVDNYEQYQQQLLQMQQQSQRLHSGKSEVPNSKQNQTNSPKRGRTRTKSKDSNINNKFGLYMHIDEVQLGLKSKTLIEGVLRINPKQFTHAYVSSEDRGEQDILIDGIKDRNRALEGDVVVVEMVTESDAADTENDGDNVTNEAGNANDSKVSLAETGQTDTVDIENSTVKATNVVENAKSDSETKPVSDVKQKLGRVVYIKEKVHHRTCIGVLKLMPDKNRQKALFVPRDHRIPRLNIPFTCWPDNFYKDPKSYENTLFLAKIEDWFDLRFATGKIIQNIGQSGDMVTETRAILAQTDLDVTPFGRKYSHLYPRLDYVIPEEETKVREDCRKLCIFSIDPSNCRDIDDAVSCRKLENGNYEIGVHISDVSHFLTEGTELDEKVAEKATTIYLVDKAYHMLPDELCMLCSLFPGVDKLAFSVFWEITEQADVLSHRFAKTVIHSCCQLAYEHAQAILEEKEDSDFPEIYNGFQYKDIYETVKTLGKIGAKFRQNRFENGALRIDQPKVAFHLNPFDGLPKSFWIYESKESHQLIEEFMLLANMTVAQRIYDDHPNLAFLRCHPPPSGYMLKQLSKALMPMGINLEIESAGSLQQSILPYVGPDNEDRGRAMVLSMLCAKPMARAKYFCANGVDDEDFHHYALNVPVYTHFTSPIRRYADIMVHRLLAASVYNKGSPQWDVNNVRMVAAQCNKQKYNAKKAGELSTELYTLKYIEMHSPMVTEAVVVEVRDKYLDVIIVAMGLNRRIYFNSDFPGEFKCVKNDAGAKLSRMEVEWQNTDHPDGPPVKQVIEVFSILQIEMRKGNDMVKVETKLVKPEPSKTD